MKTLLLLLAVCCLAGCVALNSVSTTPIPADRSQVVKAQGERFMFMLFNFDTKFVDGVVGELARQCPQGKVQGLLTKQESVTYFPLIAHAYRVTAEGYCIKGKL